MHCNRAAASVRPPCSFLNDDNAGVEQLDQIPPKNAMTQWWNCLHGSSQGRAEHACCMRVHPLSARDVMPAAGEHRFRDFQTG